MVATIASQPNIFKSDGNILTAIGSSIGYGSNLLTLSLWKYCITRESGDDMDRLDVEHVIRV